MCGRERMMHVNLGHKVGFVPLYPQGTNSTLFTECCRVAICDDEKCCPSRGREAMGSEIDDPHYRGLYRWKIAYRGRRSDG